MTSDVPPHHHARPGDRWFLALLGVTVLLHTAITMLRPMLSYRALEIGVPTAFLGIVASAFAIVPLIAAIRIGRFVDRATDARLAVAGIVLIGLAGLAIALERSLPMLLAGSAALGFGHLLVVVTTQALVAGFSGPRELDRRYGHVAFTAATGHLLGPAVGGLIAGGAIGEGLSGPVGGGVSAALLTGAVIALLALPFTLRMAPRGSAATVLAGGAPPPLPLRAILGTPGMAATMIASLTVLAAVDILMVYLPALGEEVGWSPVTVGALLAARAAASMVSRLGMGWLTDRFGRADVLIVSMGLSGGAIALLPLAGALPLAFVLVAIAGLTLGLGQPLTVSSVAARAAAGTRATALSVRMMGNRFGQVAVPLAAGLVAGATGVAGVLILTGAAIAASTAFVATGVRAAPHPAGGSRPAV